MVWMSGTSYESMLEFIKTEGIVLPESNNDDELNFDEDEESFFIHENNPELL